jgi:hypothetical protein
VWRFKPVILVNWEVEIRTMEASPYKNFARPHLNQWVDVAYACLSFLIHGGSTKRRIAVQA